MYIGVRQKVGQQKNMVIELRHETRSDTNRTVQPQKMVRGLKLWI